MVTRDDIDSFAGTLLLIRQTQKFPHLLQAKTQIAGTTNEAQSTEIAFPIGAVVSTRPIRGGKSSDPLVIADRLDLGADCFEQIADREDA